MSDPSGWLWLMLGVLGVAIAYGNALWSCRRRDFATRQKREETVRENYRRGG